jgi:hypothetical protein
MYFQSAQVQSVDLRARSEIVTVHQQQRLKNRKPGSVYERLNEI